MIEFRKSAIVWRIAVLALNPFLAIAAMMSLNQSAMAQSRGELLSIAPDSRENIDKLGRDDRAPNRCVRSRISKPSTPNMREFGLWDEIGGASIRQCPN